MFIHLLINGDGIGAEISDAVVIDADDPRPCCLGFLTTVFLLTLLGVQEVAMGYLVWVRGQVLGEVLLVERALAAIGHI